ncbi:hypothetical protein AVEN_191489-1 [Araneus ventricosus]|uniref:Uncharacterized protein n=1 Tax=Araneus ventricosus TaxID=182803 RepID=A0A4Y2UFG0_ARAVE|nr:hypothetical protein AVEN_191489-1 [Araneus ventricosus]
MVRNSQKSTSQVPLSRLFLKGRLEAVPGSIELRPQEMDELSRTNWTHLPCLSPKVSDLLSQRARLTQTGILALGKFFMDPPGTACSVMKGCFFMNVI